MLHNLYERITYDLIMMGKKICLLLTRRLWIRRTTTRNVSRELSYLIWEWVASGVTQYNVRERLKSPILLTGCKVTRLPILSRGGRWIEGLGGSRHRRIAGVMVSRHQRPTTLVPLRSGGTLSKEHMSDRLPEACVSIDHLLTV